MQKTHPHDFFDMVEFASPWGNYLISEEVRPVMTSINPLQLLTPRITVPIWEIHYEYDTVRNNHREATKYVFISEHEDSAMEAEMRFQFWVSDFNHQNKHRQLLNVKILSCEPYSRMIVDIGSMRYERHNLLANRSKKNDR